MRIETRSLSFFFTNSKVPYLNLDIRKLTIYNTKFLRRPINLSNVVSRLALKVLANWLKCFLPNIISENQSAFMSDRLIIDNVLVAFEIMHHIKQKRNGRVGEMAIKLDMSKAFVQDGLS